MSRLIELEAENFKRLKAVVIKFNETGATIIGGDNEQGKTSVLDAIESVLGGLKHSPEEPIRKGTKKARIVLKTDTITVTRTFSKKGSTIKVEGDDGAHSSPQAMLDALIGPLSFDPLAFDRMKGSEQAETIKKMVPGLDLSALDAERKKEYDLRTIYSRDLKRAEVELEGLPEIKDAPTEEVSVSELMAKLTTARAHNDEFEQRQSRADEAKREVDVRAERVAGLEEELAQFRKYLGDSKRHLDDAEAVAKEISKSSTEDIEQQIDSAEAKNRAWRQNGLRLTAEGVVARVSADVKAQTQKIEALDQKKTEALTAVEYPIEGLTIDDDGVLLDGLPWQQASHAKRIRSSTEMGFAIHADLKLALIRDGAVLDDKNMAIVAKTAEDAGGQAIIEVVGKRDGVTVVIEDGEVKDA